MSPYAASYVICIRIESVYYLYRPVIVSIEDSREYQADMVLATLLDDSTPSHPTQPVGTAASTSSSSSIPPDTTQRTAAAATQRQQHQAGGAVTVLDEDQDGIHDNGEAGAIEQMTGNNSLDQHLCGGGGPSLSFPSGSQFRKTNSRVPRKSNAIAQVVHIPQPPQDVEFMETDSLLHEDDDIGLGDHISHNPVEEEAVLGSESRAAFSQHLGSHASSRHVAEEDDDDVMDALFGEDNLDGVADHGEVFGFEHRQNQESQKLPRNQKGSAS